MMASEVVEESKLESTIPSTDDPDGGKALDESALREGLFTVHYPACKPMVCEVYLTSTELVLDEYDESGYESDCDTIQERYPIEDIYGIHIVRNQIEEPSLPLVYACFIFYTNTLDSDKCRKRVSRIFEINISKSSYQENLNVVKEWAEDIEHLLKLRYPNLQSMPPSDSSADSNAKKYLSQSVEDAFKELTAEVVVGTSTDKKDAEDKQCKGIDLEFCSGSFTLVKSILCNRKFMVIVNPVSGQGKGLHIFQEHISPVFSDCGIASQLVVTDHSGHAQALMAAADLKDIDGIVAVGGDGLINEVINGIRGREDAEKVSHIPIGVIATGSGNGLARSVAGYYGESQEYRNNPVLASTLAVARGCVSPVNLAEVHLDKRKFYSFLSVGWGLLADIDVESEILRAIGEFRFVIWSFIRLAKFRRYNAELSYIPSDASGSINSRVIIKDEFISVYSTCQSHIGTDMLFARDAKPNDATLHLTYHPSSTGRFAAARFLAELIRGNGQHVNIEPVKYVKVKEFTIRNIGGIDGTLTTDGEPVSGEEITVKMSSSPLYVFSIK